jgi:3-phenylpropionate/trans-cinnamate dioxygenase ferredoxin subunit
LRGLGINAIYAGESNYLFLGHLRGGYSQSVKVIVAPERSFAPGTRRIVAVGGRSIGIFRVGDRYFAIRNRCPHQGGPLCLGRLLDGAVSHAPGEARLQDATPMLACPWHGWEYELETGQSFMGPSSPGARSYPVALEPGATLVAELAAAGEERTPGPYVAETFDVFVEDDYVVLET